MATGIFTLIIHFEERESSGGLDSLLHPNHSDISLEGGEQGERTSAAFSPGKPAAASQRSDYLGSLC